MKWKYNVYVGDYLAWYIEETTDKWYLNIVPTKNPYAAVTLAIL